jgi:hypothetical protein
MLIFEIRYWYNFNPLKFKYNLAKVKAKRMLNENSSSYLALVQAKRHQNEDKSISSSQKHF